MAELSLEFFVGDICFVLLEVHGLSCIATIPFISCEVPTINSFIPLIPQSIIPLGLTLKACKVEEIFVQIRLFLLADKVDW